MVSKDFRTAVVAIELKERSDGFTAMVAPVRRIVDEFKHADLDVEMVGNPIYLESTELFAKRIEWLFPLAILVIGLLHFEAFRTWQGLVLPLVTALMAVVWGTGLMGVFGQSMDIFNSPTPILILAVAAGHAVQLLKRYYDEVVELKAQPAYQLMGDRQLSSLAVERSLIGVGPVMLIAGLVAAMGFLSLLAFQIAAIRSFGLFTAGGILSAVIIELSFTPAVRSLLKAPHIVKSSSLFWTRIPQAIGEQLLRRSFRKPFFLSFAAVALIAAYASSHVLIDNASKRFFSDKLALHKADDFLNQQTGGTNSLYIMVESYSPERMKSPEVLKAMDELANYAKTLPELGQWVGKTVSIADYIRRMNQSMHADDKAYNVIPASSDLVSQYLLLYSMSGSQEDFDSLIDYGYQHAKITVLLKTGSNAVVEKLVKALDVKSKVLFPSDIKISFGGDVAQTIALTETMVKGKLLNILVVSAVIVLVSSIVFRSLLAGIIILLPLLASVLAVFGVMGAFSIPLNIPNSLIAAMAVGLGSDYAIYLMYRIREYARQGIDVQTAIQKAIVSAGQASLFVATAVAGGYAVLALSYDYMVHVWLSMFIVIAMLVSVFASLYLVPLSVLILKPSFLTRASTTGGAMMEGVVPSSLVVLLALGLCVWHTDVQAQGIEANVTNMARTLVQKSDDAIRVKDSTAQATFTLTSRDGLNRVRKTHGYTKQQAGSTEQMRLIKFLSPSDIKGTATLLIEHNKAEDDIWVYLPALSKTRRLSANQKKDSFIGTDFSFGDVLGHKVDEWSYTIKSDDMIDGAICWVVEALPLSDEIKKNSGYSKRVLWIRKDNYVGVQQDFFDPSGQLIKRILATDIKPISKNKWLAFTTAVENLQTGHKTVLRYDDYKADTGLSNDLFSTQALER